MTTPPARKSAQKDYIHSAVRLPPDLNEAIKQAAELNGRSMNAEIIARLQAAPSEIILSEIAELKALVRKILDQM